MTDQSAGMAELKAGYRAISRFVCVRWLFHYISCWIVENSWIFIYWYRASDKAPKLHKFTC